jgi:putrescine importer
MTPDGNSQPTPSSQPSPARLRRVLGLGDLVFYGLVLIQPVGAVGIFGLADQRSHGHVTLTILIALAAMMLTALSYGRMAGLYPAAGSAYTYVGRGLHPHCGFIAGWAMFLDYLVIPIVSVIYGAISIQKVVDVLAPGWTQHAVASLGLPFDAQRVAFVVWVVLLISLTTFLNVRGIQWTAHANQVLTGVMFLVIAIFLVQAVRYLWLEQGLAWLLSTKPFYNPRTFNLGAIGTATSLAALTYIGFDGITTLAEDVKEPKRTVPLAVVLVCVIIGLCVGLQVYLAQRAWPDYTTFKDPDTAFFDVCKLVGGTFLLNAMAVILAVACLGSALTGQVGAARILFGMGRDNALPKFFARLNKRDNPVLNIWLIGMLALLGALLLNYEKAATLINFGAFLAFMGVNLAVIREFFFRPPSGHKRHLLLDLTVPAAAFLFCLWIWASLPVPAKVLGMCWLGFGLIVLAIQTCGFLPLLSVRGRVGRRTFWLVLIGTALPAPIVSSLLTSATEKNGQAIWITMVELGVVAIWFLCAAWLNIAVQIKRWHDRGRSGLMILINMVPMIGAVWTIIELGFLKGTNGPNRYGNSRLEAGRQLVMIDLSGS